MHLLTLWMVVTACMLDECHAVSSTLPIFPVFASLRVVARHEKVIENGCLNRLLDINMSLISEPRSTGGQVVNV